MLYADDVTLIEPVRSATVPNNLKSIQAWVDVNKMSLNLNKSKQMIFYRSVAHDVAYSTIPVVHSLKILGVTWNDKLSWCNHFNEILKLSSQRLFVVRTLKSVLTKKELIVVYHSLILSLLLHVFSLFVSLPVNIDNKLQYFHNRAHRMNCGVINFLHYFYSLELCIVFYQKV